MHVHERPELWSGDRHDVPDLVVKPLPGASRSSTGANMVPRKSTAPSGYW